MRSSRVLILIVMAGVIVALASPASSNLAARAEATGPHAASAAQPIRFPFLRWLKPLARHHVHTKIEIGEFPKHAALHALKHWSESWDHSEGEQVRSCSRYLPARFFCAPPQRYYRLGVGYAIPWNDRRPAAWSSPTWPRYVRGYLYEWRLYWLSCWTGGDTLFVPYRNIKSNLWYRLLVSGYYVNDAWLDTGTNYRIRGVRQCVV